MEQTRRGVAQLIVGDKVHFQHQSIHLPYTVTKVFVGDYGSIMVEVDKLQGQFSQHLFERIC